MYKKKPFFIVFEGIEGCGKSFQSKKLFKRLKKNKIDAILTTSSEILIPKYLIIVAIFGAATWFLDNFTHKDNLKRITAICGVISMISLLYVTFTTEGL